MLQATFNQVEQLKQQNQRLVQRLTQIESYLTSPQTDRAAKSTAFILYCQAQSSYCNIVLKPGKQYLISKTLKRVQAVLNPFDFIKVHKSYIVCMDSIQILNEGLILVDDSQIPIARSKRNEVKEKLSKRFQMV